MAELNDKNGDYDVVEEFLPPLYVQLARVYDLLAVIAMKVDPHNAERVLDKHEVGKFYGAPPALAADDGETDE